MQKTMLSIMLACALAGCGERQHTTTTARLDLSEPLLAHRRALALRWLHDYRVAGVFPTDDAGLPIGVFRDAHGVRCPMSELIYRSGRADLVDAVATTDNRLRLADVHDGPVMDWMLGSGLTQEEAVMVQGAMSWRPMVPKNNVEHVNGGNNLQIVRVEAHDAVVNKLAGFEVKLRADSTASLRTAASRQRPAQRAASR